MLDVRDLFKNDYVGKEITVNGWIRNHRKQKEFGFIDFSDGTTPKHLQVVYDNSLDTFDEIAKMHIGSAVSVTGKLIKSPNYIDKLSNIIITMFRYIICIYWN